MSVTITPVSAGLPSLERRIDPSAATAATVTKTTPTQAAPAAGAVERQVSFDEAGFLVVRSIDATNQEIVAQNPTEAYLRLAHAMIEAVRADQSGDGPGAEVVA